jgi:hypothetical protein
VLCTWARYKNENSGLENKKTKTTTPVREKIKTTHGLIQKNKNEIVNRHQAPVFSGGQRVVLAG